MAGGLIDFSAIARDTHRVTCLPRVGHHDGRDVPLRLRRVRALLSLSNCIYSPRTTIPPGYKPAMYQLKPLDKLNQAWFGDFLQDEKDGITTPKYPRRGILIADEGGMGKTLSSAIIALDELYKSPDKSVVVVCPKMMKKEWESIFKWTPFPVSRIRGSQLIEGHCRTGLNIIGKHELLHALAGHDHQAVLAQHHDEISLLILDEAHEGFLVDPEAVHSEEGTFSATLQESIGALTAFAERLVLVTATPMRHNRDDLIRLCDLIDEGELDRFLPKQDDAWYEELRTRWLPALEHLREGGSEIDGAIETITSLLHRFVPLPSEDRSILEDALANLSNTALRQDKALRTNLADDLHPLGRYLSVTLRDDLGEDKFREMFRTSSTTTHAYQNPRTTDLVEALAARLDGGAGWRGDLTSCSLNALDQHYAFARRLRSEGIVEEFRAMIELAWGGDQRLSFLFDLVGSELETRLDTAQGMVVFSSRSGTNRALKEVLEERFGDEIEVFLFHPPSGDEQERRNAFLRKARKHAQTGHKLPVILSGESGSVGQNMEWANVVVHWDAIRSPAMLEQKSWRLDRRVKTGDGITREFHVHHFVHKDKQADYIEGVNRLHQQQRLLLGDRRFFHGTPPSLVPLLDGTERQKHTPSVRQMCLKSTQANWLKDFILGETTSPNSHAAEVMAQAALIQCSGFDFWDGMSSQQLLDESPLSPPRQLGDCETFDLTVWERRFILHTLMTLTKDSKEQESLKQFAGGFANPAPLVTQSGSLLMNHPKPRFLPRPGGQLFQKLTEVVLNLEARTDHYPMVVYNHDVERVPPFKLFVHTGIMILNLHPLGQHIKSVRGEETHCGLVRLDPDGSVQFLTYADLSKPENKYDVLFQHIAALADQDVYPDDHFPESNDAAVDAETILEAQADYRNLYFSSFGLHSDLFPLPWEASLKLMEMRGEEDTTPLDRPHSRHLLPLVNVHSSKNARDALCPACGAARQCRDMSCFCWDPANEIELMSGEMNESGWM